MIRRARTLAAGLLLALAATWLALAAPVLAQDGGPSAFPRTELNPGLPPRPETFDLSTPQSAVESFLAAANAEQWELAAHALDLSLVPDEAQAERAPVLARMLATIIDRKVMLRWSELPERPDALVEGGGRNQPLAGQPRKSLLLGLLDLDGRDVEIRLNRIKPDDQEAVWVFAAPTVENLPALYDRYKPPPLEESLPDPLHVDVLWGLRLWEVLFLPPALLAVALIAYGIWRLVTHLSGRFRHWAVRGLLLSTRLPLALGVVAALLSYLTGSLLVVSSAASAVIEPTILLMYVAAVVILIVNAIDAVLDRIADTNPADMASPDNAVHRGLATQVSAARRVLLVTAVVLSAGIVLSSANIFRTLGFSLLASAGVLTLVMAFAARELLGNILSSLQISLNRSARIGDFLVFEGHWCTVERIYLTYVQLQLWTGNRLIVPVSYFVQQPFENWSHEEFKMLRIVKLKLASGADVQVLRERMEAFAEQDDRIDPPEEAFCYVTSHDEFGKEVLFAIPVPIPDAGWAAECALREYLLDEARRLGVELPAQPPRPDAA